MVYPPSGIVPFRGMSFLAAPFFFLFPSLDLCYFAFRESYCALFSRSQIISGRTTCSTAEDDSAVGLAKLFEDLLSSCEPVLYLHLMKLGVDPLEIALPWLFTSFAGYLSVDQLLILWDRLVAYDSLHLAAVLAVSIFIFRSEFLMLAENADMIRVRVILFNRSSSSFSFFFICIPIDFVPHLDLFISLVSIGL